MYDDPQLTTLSGDAALETPADAGEGQQGQVNRWLMELDLAGKVEKDWRKNAKKAIERYRDEKDRTERQFNIYWANVETLRPALYSTAPKVDVRPRFPDADPVGKLAAEVLERALEFSLDSYDFDEEMDNITLDYLLPSRAVARVRFSPTIEEKEDGEGNSYDEVTYAETYCEHVPWERFRRGPGITWKEVPWIAYEHQLTHTEVDKKFPGFGQKVSYDIVMEGVDGDKADASPSIFKRVRVWEIWDKQTRKIYWLAPSWKESFLLVEEDKLKLADFFDCERPLYAVKTATSLVPQVEYRMYSDQAKELDRVTARINKLVSSLKQRGIYDSTVAEFKELLKAADNEMVPTSTASALMQAGGLDKGIWMMPIEEAAAVLKALIEYREQVKQTIYELTGISDILRGSTDPVETLGAQKLKAQTGGKRIQRRQRDVQRFIRGLLRKKAEIIAENYTPQILSLMTGIQLPYDADKQAAQMQMIEQATQQGTAAQANPQHGGGVPSAHQPDPKIQQILATPSWEDVMKVLQNDMLRAFRVDIETDSTIASDQEAEREQVTEFITGVGNFVKSVGPAVTEGAISPEAAKKLLLAALRRFKFGREVEDVIDQDMGSPMPEKPDPEAQKAQAQAQADQAKLQGQMQLEDKKHQNALALEQFKAENEAKVAMAEQQAQAQQDAQEQRLEAAREWQKMMLEQKNETQKMILDHRLDMEKMQAALVGKLHEIAAQQQAKGVAVHIDGKDELSGLASHVQDVTGKHTQILEGIAQVIPALTSATQTLANAHQEHGALLKGMAEHAAGTHQAIADGLARQNQILAADVQPVRDANGRMIAARKVLQ